MKKLIIIFLIIVIIISIYLITSDKKIYYLNISDTENPYSIYILKYLDKENKLEKTSNFFSKEDYRISEFINDVKENKKIENDGKIYTLNSSLVKADLITISIGNTDLYYKMNYYDVNEMYNYIDEILIEYDELFKILKKLTKERIIILGYTIPNKETEKLISYYNEKLEYLCKKYNIGFIKIDQNAKMNLKKEINQLLK